MALPQIFSTPLPPQLKVLPGLRLGTRTAPRRTKTGRLRKQAVTVNTLMETLDPLPQQAVLLGRCADGLPFLMSLGDPELGAILIVSQQGYGKTHHLQTLVDSALQTHSPRKLQVAVLTLNPGEWTRLTGRPAVRNYLQGVAAWYDPQAEALIASLTELAESRREGRQRGPDILLALDDLPALQDLTWETQVNLRWLLEYGSQSGIWIVATVNAAQVARFRYWIETFRTRIIGRVDDKAAGEVLALDEIEAAKVLSPGEFRAWTGSEWVSYTLPLLGDVRMKEG
jgi:hypothetical protein